MDSWSRRRALFSYPATDNVGYSLLDYLIQNDNRKKNFATDNQLLKKKQTENATEKSQ